MKKARKCDSCHAQVTPSTASWISVQRTTREFVDSDWSRNSASRSCAPVNNQSHPLSAKAGQAYPLEHLLPPNILHPLIQITDPLDNIVNLALIRALDFARLANRHVQRELDGAMHPAPGQPAPARLHVLGRDAEPVLAAVGSGEGEAAAGGTPLRDDAVVVVKGFFDGYEDARVRFRDVVFCVVVPDFGIVVA
jgi:hypothetical protein